MPTETDVPRRRARSASRLVPALAVVAVLLGGACSRGAAPPSQADYVAAADAACERRGEAIDELEEEVLADPDHNRPERWIRADLVPEYRKLSNELRSLAPPSGDATYLSGIYADFDRRVNWLFSRPSEGRAAVRDDERLQLRFAQYGMEVCGTV